MVVTVLDADLIPKSVLPTGQDRRDTASEIVPEMVDTRSADPME
jgi:hypothetical protein